ncbi:MAG TPA: alpha/beta fold hydrolase [Polyangia bacterium]|jgi:hypothetical protein
MTTPELPVSIPANDATLDGRLALPTAPRAGVVLCHPHPAFNGTMDASVLVALARHLSSRGYATLRFDFRGIGSSTGEPTGGDREGEDVLAAVQFLRGRDVEQVCVAGYSFGAAAALDALWRGGDFAATACIGFPTEGIAVGSPQEARVRETIRTSRRLLFIGGTVDPYSSPEMLEAWGGTVERLLAVGHFYSSRDEEQICRLVAELFLAGTVRLT